jgi:hypothetical protein
LEPANEVSERRAFDSFAKRCHASLVKWHARHEAVFGDQRDDGAGLAIKAREYLLILS